MIRKQVNAILGKFGYSLISAKSTAEQKKKNRVRKFSGGYNPDSFLPQSAENYLRYQNPRFMELKKSYESFDKSATTPLVWVDTIIDDKDLLHFRGDNAYVWQIRGKNTQEASYGLSYYYLKSIDTLGLLDCLDEDRSFGNFVYEMDGRLVSRDLIDSCLELNFLQRHLHIAEQKDLKILDIGAGYGRLAHRTTASIDAVADYVCTDAVPQSTFLSEYYLKYRQADKAKVVALTEIENYLSNNRIDLAVNIHSFSECQPDAIKWWVNQLKKNNIQYLMVVPNAMSHGGTQLLTSNRISFESIITDAGYKLLVSEHKYSDPFVQKHGMNPTCYYLFELMI